jgi:cephalosporin-C deacetylase
VQFQGYSGGRGLPHENNLWALAGYAHLVVDTRGQGWGTTVGATPDPVSSPPSAPGLMTKGILDPATYYYRRVYVDAVRAVAAARSHPRVEATRLAVVGASQGGGLSVVAGALAPGVSAVMADVPFLCHFRRATGIATDGPYLEIARYLASHRDDVERAFTTLGYFDVANLAKRATAPALFSVALMDQVCPPSTCMAAYRLYGGPTDLRIYEFNDHEGGAAFQQREQLRWLRERL